jgi:tetratricopeptide (TPR) repeat protein
MPNHRGPDRDELVPAVRELGEALRSVRRRPQRWLAWQQLTATDEYGVGNVRPYTAEAIALLETACALDGDDCDVIHHLAIAYHAMAWDLELCEPHKASQAWEKALFYWRKLQACGRFWRDLCAKGEALGEGFDKTAVVAFRQNLMRYLLEIHVDFIRHYYELKQHDQASRHIELIRRARISPAARKELAAIAYEVMASNVPAVVAAGRFGDALAMLDGFLSLFPFHPPALQSYLEIAKQWLDRLSPTRWQEILELDRQALPRWDALSTTEHLSEHPLARVALNDWAIALGGKHWARAGTLLLQRSKAKQVPQTLECEEYHACELAILWFRKAEQCVPDSAEVRAGLFNALRARAEFTTYVGWNSDDHAVAYRLFEEALADCEDVMKMVPGETSPCKLAAQILKLRAEYRLRHVPAGLSNSDLAAHIRSIEEDLERAIQLDPDNQSLQEMLVWVQEEAAKTR